MSYCCFFFPLDQRQSCKSQMCTSSQVASCKMATPFEDWGIHSASMAIVVTDINTCGVFQKLQRQATPSKACIANRKGKETSSQTLRRKRWPGHLQEASSIKSLWEIFCPFRCFPGTGSMGSHSDMTISCVIPHDSMPPAWRPLGGTHT